MDISPVFNTPEAIATIDSVDQLEAELQSQIGIGRAQVILRSV